MRKLQPQVLAEIFCYEFVIQFLMKQMTFFFGTLYQPKSRSKGMGKWTGSELQIGRRHVQRIEDAVKCQGCQVDQGLGLSSLKG